MKFYEGGAYSRDKTYLSLSSYSLFTRKNRKKPDNEIPAGPVIHYRRESFAIINFILARTFAVYRAFSLLSIILSQSRSVRFCLHFCFFFVVVNNTQLLRSTSDCRSTDRVVEPWIDAESGGHQGRRRRLFRVSHQGQSSLVEIDMDTRRAYD